MNIIQQEDLQPLTGFGLFPQCYACVNADNPAQYLIHSISKDVGVAYDAAAFFEIEDFHVVEISQALYEWLLNQSPKSESMWMTADDFQPEIPKVPLEKLPLDDAKCDAYDKRIQELMEEYKEEGLFKNTPKARDRFRPYHLITKVTEPDIIVLDEDAEDLDTSVIHVSYGNAHNTIPDVSNYDEVEDHPWDSWMFGLADNATQVVNHLNQCLRTYFTGNSMMDGYREGLQLVSWMQYPNGKLMLHVSFTPREDEPQCGLRWHKYGAYIGKHNVQCEYLNDEVGIDYIMKWDLYLLEPETEQN